MIKINFLKLTTIFVFLFVLSSVFYYLLSLYVFNAYDSTEEISKYVVDNYKLLLQLEPIIKQLLLACTIGVYGLGISQNILKLSNINNNFKQIYFIFTLVVVGGLFLLSLITSIYGSIAIYTITTFLMFLMTLIWITTILIDFIKTKNNYQSIFIRVALALLGCILIVTVGDKVINDYKVNTTLVNSYEYKIAQLETQLDFVDEESKEWINTQIELYNNMMLPLYSNGLYSGKSYFFMYNSLKIDMFSENKLVQTENAINVIEDLVDNYNNNELTFDTYDINAGMYVSGSISKILVVLILVLGVICTIKFPLIRAELDDEKEVEELVTIKFIRDVITKEEYKTLMGKLE